MEYFSTWKRRREKKYQIIYKRGPSTLALVFAGMALALWAIFIFLSSFPVFLYIYYAVLPKTSEALSRSLENTRAESVVVAKEQVKQVPPVLIDEERPSEISKDLSLPEGQFIAIPTIGVDTQVWEADSNRYEEALRKGVWRVPEFAKPDDMDNNRPIILAAHRFGYVSWTQKYREKNSFYQLPEVKVGESVILTWNQHRYTYKITKIEEGTAISDYASDLILYTCKFLVSPQRVFVYAELIK